VAQFSVFRSPRRDPDVAFVVQIQANRFDQARGRVVLALIHRGNMPPPDHAFTPHLMVLGVPVYVDALDIATVPVNRLGPSLTVLPESDQGRIITAIDELIAH